MRNKLIGVLWVVVLTVGIISAAGDNAPANPLFTPVKLTTRETVNITNPVKSYDELLNIISGSLNNVCENLTLSIKNTNQWFNKRQFDKCINQANLMSLRIGPYYSGYKFTSTTGDNLFIKMKIHFVYRFPRTTLLRYLNEAENKATDIVNAVITPNMNDYQKELALHDYIVNHAHYDDINYQNNTVPNESYTPYGILIKNTGVCAGYAHTMRLLLNKNGIECIVVSGKADGGDHAWNIVKLDDKYYHLDVTWDDPVGKDQLRYYYFNLTDDMIAVNHAWDQNRYPRCNTTDYNYYHINNLWVADMEECKQRIQNIVANGAKNIQLKISDFNLAAFKKTIKSVLNEMRFVGRYTYSYDEDLGIVEIEFSYFK